MVMLNILRIIIERMSEHSFHTAFSVIKLLCQALRKIDMINRLLSLLSRFYFIGVEEEIVG